jgi:hypothetical protein
LQFALQSAGKYDKEERLMTNHEQDFDPPRIILVKEVDGHLDFGLLPKDFRRFGSFQMVCAGLAVRSEHGFDLLTSERYLLPAGATETETKDWHRRAIGFVHAQWQAYAANGFKLPGYPSQEEAFNEILSHSVRNLGTDIMTEEEIDQLEETLHNAFMQMLDRKMGLSIKGLSGRYAMGGHA